MIEDDPSATGSGSSGSGAGGGGQLIEVTSFVRRTPVERVRDYLLLMADLAEVPPTPLQIAAAVHLPPLVVKLALGDLEQHGVIERRYSLRRRPAVSITPTI